MAMREAIQLAKIWRTQGIKATALGNSEIMISLSADDYHSATVQNYLSNNPDLIKKVDNEPV